MFLRKNKNTKNDICYKVTAQDHTDPDNIKFNIKILASGKNKIVSLKDLFYQDEWLSGFGLDDVRMIAKVYAQAEWYRDKERLRQGVADGLSS
jgi:hypothetical protein